MNEIQQKVIDALNKVRPALQADGGDAKFIEMKEDGTVVIEFLGACHGCPMSAMTLKDGIERYIRQSIPEVKSVEALAKGFW